LFTRVKLVDFLVKQANGVKGLAELNHPDFPHQYIQPVQANNRQMDLGVCSSLRSQVRLSLVSI